MMETDDGFQIAERDLRLRGPGELLGIRQSGFLNFRVADLLVHGPLLLQARDDAKSVLQQDPGLLLPANAVILKSLAALAASDALPMLRRRANAATAPEREAAAECRSPRYPAELSGRGG